MTKGEEKAFFAERVRYKARAARTKGEEKAFFAEQVRCKSGACEVGGGEYFPAIRIGVVLTGISRRREREGERGAKGEEKAFFAERVR